MPIVRVMVLKDGLGVFTHSLLGEGKTNQTDEQLLGGMLEAIKSFGSELGTEIQTLMLHKLCIYYRVLKIADQNLTMVFMGTSDCVEEDVRIRMEYACQVFLGKYQHLITKANVILSLNDFEAFIPKLEDILTLPRDQLDNAMPTTYLQALTNSMVDTLPAKMLGKILVKQGFFYDDQARTFIAPSDLSEEKEQELIHHLEMSVQKLFGKKKMDNIKELVSRKVGKQE